MKIGSSLWCLVGFTLSWVLCSCPEASAGAFRWNYKNGIRLTWDNNVVPYAFDQTSDLVHQPLTFPQQLQWEKVIRGWQKAANINFVKRTTETDFVNLSNTSIGGEDWGVNFSWIARSSGGQPLWIHNWDDHLVLHECGHALGFTHEHQRSDRDAYVDCWWWNVYAPPGPQINFTKESNSDNRTVYDLYSVMHYAKNIYAGPWPKDLLTLHPKDENFLDIIGQNNWFGNEGTIPADGMPRYADMDDPDFVAEYKKVGTYGFLSPLDRVAIQSEYGAPAAIGGTVTKAAGGARLSKAMVTLKGVGNTVDTVKRMIITREAPSVTDTSGVFLFEGLPNGSYILKPKLAGYKFTPETQTVTVSSGSTSGANFTAVLDESAPPDVDFVLPSTAGTPKYKILSGVNGTATDGEGSGVKEVGIAFSDYRGYYYNWTTQEFDSASFTGVHRKLATGTTNWTLSYPSFPTLTDGWYQVHANAVDLAGNDSGYDTQAFYIDNTVPSIAFSPLVDGQKINDLGKLGGTVSDALTDVTVVYQIFEDNGGGGKDRYWNGAEWVNGSFTLSGKVEGNLWKPAEKLPTRLQLKEQGFYLYAKAIDGAGNTNGATIRVSRTATDTTVPDLAITAPTANQILTTSSIPAITGTASDAQSGLSEVTVYLEKLKSGGGFQTWNGTAWVDDQVALGVNLNESTGTWSAPATSEYFTYQLPSGSNLPNGQYQVQAYAKNNESPAGTRGVAVNFSVDYHPSYTWTGYTMRDNVSGNDSEYWQTPENWSPYGVPGAGDTATIAIGDTVRSSTPITLHGFNMSAGILDFVTSSHSLTITKAGTWSGGQINDIINIPTGTVFNITGADTKRLGDVSTLNNSGVINWQGGPLFQDGYYGASNLNNLSGGVYNLTGDGTPFTTNGYAYFNNAAGAKLVKSAGTGTTSLSGWRLNNSGELRSTTGTLETRSDVNLNGGGRLIGPGLHLKTDGMTTLTGITTADNTTVTVSGGTIKGADDTAVFASVNNGVWNWAGGTFDGKLSNTGAFTFKGAVKTLNDLAVFTNKGTIDWTSGSVFSDGYYGPAIFNNSKIFNVSTPEGFTTIRSARFNNQSGGTLTRTGSGTTTVKWTYNNDGITRSNAGTLSLEGGGAGAGSFQTAAAGLIYFNGADHALASPTITGAGKTLISAGTVTVNGTLTLGDSSSVSSLYLLNGMLNGTATLKSGSTSRSTLYWTGGTIAGNQTWNSNLAVNITDAGLGDYTKVVGDVSTINNGGVVTFSSTKPIFCEGYYGQGTINNLSGGIFNLENPVQLLTTNRAATFNNLAGGKLVKNGTGVTTLKGWGYTNAGELLVTGGMLEFGSTLNMTAGTRFNGAGTVKFNGTVNVNCPVTSTAKVLLAGGSLTGTSGFTFYGPQFDWADGEINGQMTLLKGSVMNLSGTAKKTLGDKAEFNNQATVNWSGLGPLFSDGYYGPASFNNQSGASVNWLTDGTPFTTTRGAIFNNLAGGQVNKRGGTGVLSVAGWGFNNGIWDGSKATAGGIIRCDAGTLDFNNDFKHNGGIYQGNGAHTWSGGTAVSRGTIILADTKLTLSGARMENPNVSGVKSTLSTSASGAFNWTGGTIAGNLWVGSKSVFNISGSADKTLDDVSVLNNQGVVTWSGGKIFSEGYYGPALINNLSDGVFKSRSDNYLATNRGTNFSNAGILDLGSNILSSTWSYTQTGTGKLQTAIKGASSFGQLVIAGNLSLTGTLNPVLTDAYLPAAGAKFKVISHSSRTGTFSAVTTLGTDNRSFTATYNPADVTLTTSQPSLSVNDVRVFEDSNPGLTAVFTVSLSATRTMPITVKYETVNGTATAGADYTATSGTLTFAPGEKSKTVVVPILSDVIDEVDETFYLKLSSPTNVAILDGTGDGIIVDNDTSSIAVLDAKVTEGKANTTALKFEVKLSVPNSRIVTVKAMTGVTSLRTKAVAPADFASFTGQSVTFAPGETSKFVTVNVKGDLIDEDDEGLTLLLSSPVNAVIGDGVGEGIIVDDDNPPTISASDASVTEGNTDSQTKMNFTLTLSAPSSTTVTVKYVTANGTAISGSDYSASSGTVTFAPGETSKTVTIMVAGDSVDEVDETFNLNLYGATKATLTKTSAIGTIKDDDTSGISINSPSVTEGNTGTKTLVFTVKLSVANSRSVTVAYKTADVTPNGATTGSDYVPLAPGVLNFVPGETTKTLSVTINGDTVDEPDEKFNVLLSGATSAVISQSTGVGTIFDDDPTPKKSAASAVPSMTEPSDSVNRF